MRGFLGMRLSCSKRLKSLMKTLGILGIYVIYKGRMYILVVIIAEVKGLQLLVLGNSSLSLSLKTMMRAGGS